MYFFFSYSRQNNDSFLRDFFADLNKSVQELVGQSDDAGFFDQTGLEPGDFWENKLEQALSTSRVFVAAVTAGYVKSDYCGREWAAFESRIEAYAGGRNIQMPPLILPILWIPSVAPLPKEITARQYSFGNPEDDHNKSGLVRLYKLKQRYEIQRVNYLEALAKHIITLHDEHAALEQASQVPELEVTTSAFVSEAGPSQPGATPVKGPSRVHFVFGAARPDEVSRVGRRNVEPYGGLGGEEWRPYFPGSRKIGSIARQTAALDEFNFWPGQMTVSNDLPARIRAAEASRELVVMFVDGWTAELPQYQAVLQAFDQQNYLNCSVIVPWNDEDPENQTNNQRLMNAVRGAFRFRSGGQNDLYYRAQIKSEDELRRQLVEILTRLRAEVINKSSPAPGVIPETAGNRPIIAGPGSNKT